MTETTLSELIIRARLEGENELDLSGRYLTDLPEELGSLVHLQSLRLGWNRDTGRRNYLTLLPEWMAKLTNLQSLDINGNSLTLLPEWMAKLTNLQSLDVSNTKLTSLPEWMAKLTNLQSLDVSNTNLTSLPEWMAKLTNLQSLDVSNTNLTSLPEWMAKLTNLQSLDVRNTKLTSLPEWMAQLTNLQSLNVGYTSLTLLPEWMAKLTNLQSLDVSNTKLTSLPEWMAKLTNLQSLDVGYTSLTLLPEWMAKLTNLQSLDISGNILKLLPKWMAKLTNLHSLDARNNKLTLLPEWMAKLTNLQSLAVGYNSLTSLPEWMKKLTNLHSLDVTGNSLTSLPEWMAKLTNLQSLAVSRNSLTLLPEWMAKLTNLQSLYASNTKLTLVPEWMAKLTNLRSLDVHSTNLTSVPEWIAELVNLRSLNVSDIKLTSLPEWMAKLTNLQYLHVRSTNLTSLPEWMAKLTNLQSLNVSNTKLTSLPEWMAKLTNLQSLDVSNTKLTSLPKWMAKLTNLQYLNVSHTLLTSLPEWMAKLTNLQSLDVSNTKLTSLPKWMAKLTNLQYLDVSDNNLTSLPGWMAKLTNLRFLNVSNTKLTSLPEWMAKLTNLQSLYAGHNNLKSLPEWMADPKNLPGLIDLSVTGCPLLVPPLEVIGKHFSADIDAIRRYFRQLREADSVYIYEAKLLIIGEGGAGKTSLARKLVNPHCNLESNERSTEGIDIINWQFPILDNLHTAKSGDQYTVKIWDFGGQEIYFATHQFFLTKRSVYLLVADTRRQHTDFYEWLRMQETFGEDSPVLLVKNQNRQHGNSFSIENMPQLRDRFSNLRDPVIEIDLNEIPSCSGWRDLQQSIQKFLLELPDIKEPRPSTWLAVRAVIQTDSRHVITWGDFVTICQGKGMRDIKDIAQLGEYMHRVGDILYFHEDPILQDCVILKPTWGLDAVYKVLDNKEIEKDCGKFSHGTLRQLWSNPLYNGYHVQLLRLMQNFQLCYPLPDAMDNYIAPQLLQENPIVYQWDNTENLQLRYRYPVFMPRGILSRMIVKLHHYIENQRSVWRSGVILSDQYARAEVIELRGEREIRIRVAGRNKGDLLRRIFFSLEELHQSFRKLNYAQLVPCNCQTCTSKREPHFFDLTALRGRLANHKDAIECSNPPYNPVSIRNLLEDFRWFELIDIEKKSTIINIMTGRDTFLNSPISHSRIDSEGTSIHASDNANFGQIVSADDSQKKITDAEKMEWEQLTRRKTEIEKGLYLWATVIMMLYIIIYAALIPLLWKSLHWLIVKYEGWEKFEPISWVAASVWAFAGPLVAWLNAEDFSPCAVRKKVFEYWRTRDFVKYGFDMERYQTLLARQAKTSP